MNWKHVKNLFLLLLLAVNVLLVFFVYTDYSDTAFTDSDTAAHASAVLEKSGILVSPTKLAVKNDASPSLSVSYDRESYLLSVAAFLLGKTPDGIYLLPDGIRAETASGDAVLLGQDLSVAYSAAVSGAAAKAVMDESRALPLPEEHRENALSAFSKALDLPESAFSEATFLQGDGYTFLILQQTESGIPITGMLCTFGIADGRIVYAQGRHFFGAPTEREEAPLLNRANILLSERDREKRGTVETITLCYALYEDSESKLLRFIPAYTVTYAEGTPSVVNAINGKPI